MNYLEFHKQWHELGCFSIYQIYAWCRDFNRLNLRNWMKKGLIVKLRKEYYAFSECLKWPDFANYIANRIYRPSYISLHTALSFYGMIPEEVVQITSVSPHKTKRFTNVFGEYAYHTIKREMMFGYRPLSMLDGRSIFIATPEKAIIDLLYLYPFYKSEEDMIELRFDDAFMEEDLDKERLLQYADRIGSPALNTRIQTLFKAYEI